MQIRFATPPDKEKVLTLFDEFSLLFETKDIPSHIGGNIYDEMMKRNDIKIFLAEDKDMLIGLATFYILPNIRHGRHRGHIEDFFITASWRGKGVGSQIFSAVKKYCRKHSINVIKLDSEKNLHASHAFYEKNGGKYTENMFRFDIK